MDRKACGAGARLLHLFVNSFNFLAFNFTHCANERNEWPVCSKSICHGVAQPIEQTETAAVREKSDSSCVGESQGLNKRLRVPDLKSKQKS